jgi:hypothetical protein
MGDVYQATDSKLGRRVAIKLLPEAFSQKTAFISPMLSEPQSEPPEALTDLDSGLS